MKNATELLMARAKCGCENAVTHLELASAQFKLAARHENLPEGLIDFPIEIDAALSAAMRAHQTLAEVLSRKAVAA